MFINVHFPVVDVDWVSEFAKKQEMEEKSKKLKVNFFIYFIFECDLKKITMF